MILKAYKSFEHAKRAGVYVSGAAIIAMMLLIVAGIVMRNTAGHSIPASYEIVEKYLMPLAVLPPLAYIYGAGFMPRMDLLLPRLSSKARGYVISVLTVVEIVLFSFATVLTWNYAVNGIRGGDSFTAAGSVYIQWPVYFLVPLAFGAIVIELCFVLVSNRRRTEKRWTVTDTGGDFIDV
ncbi:TRAP transporter small permease [Arthrobacter sulfonylureivorans]|uniref:TRAP transporter small permease n=1 Tax=Arthrobacter sulfonylureivorans TaxID=2486855 RepID=A0ABY3WHV0_9MICC|nr:TRAP transporter small permease subunit [Arthrobacter sulfonylureivorans]UNK47882.1 TRAP transporter small permease [Arthrobacter sulfonylureivorans]